MSDASESDRRRGAAAAEVVDVLDEDGAVTGTATRAEVRAGRLWHRSVFVAVVSDAAGPPGLPTAAPGPGCVAVHQRAAWKDVWPGCWDVAFGGVLDAGESWDAAAARELAEEAGIVGAELVPVGEGAYEDGAVRERARIYRVRHDGPLSCPDGEVAATAWVPLDELASWLAAHDVVPDSLALVVPHLRIT